MTIKDRLTGDLLRWDDIRDEEWNGILIGNGASIAIWDKFNYTSIFKTACSSLIQKPLDKEDVRVFHLLKTTNFEIVLNALSTAININRIFKIKFRKISLRHRSIKNALLQALRVVHISWEKIPETTFKCIAAELSRYKQVFSTNYDLLIYWTIMHRKGRGFKDQFYGQEFRVVEANKKWGSQTRIYYLHGGLHLYEEPIGRTLKRFREPFNSLLELFGTPFGADAVPLIITEGSSEEKLVSINQSEYLSYAFSEFKNHNNSIVIFGHSLSDNDEHISSAIRDWNKKKIAISLLPGDTQKIIRLKAQYISKLKCEDIYFFDATTFPLGNPSLKVAAKP